MDDDDDEGLSEEFSLNLRMMVRFRAGSPCSLNISGGILHSALVIEFAFVTLALVAVGVVDAAAVSDGTVIRARSKKKGTQRCLILDFSGPCW